MEEVYRAGTPDGKVPPGLLRAVPQEGQRLPREGARVRRARAGSRLIAALIRYYQTGDPADWLRFGIAWVQNNPTVDFANGFIEVYRDARGAKGTSQSFVTITDEKLNQLMVKLAANAQYFEDRAPWAPAVQEAGRQAAAGQGRRDRDRDRRFPRQHDRRQPAQRKRNPREVRQQELPVHRQFAHPAPGHRLRARSRSSPPRPKRSPSRKKYGEEAAT